MSTTWEQLEGAALSLVRSGTIKDRLTEAYRMHLALIDAEELPENLRAPFRACHEALTHEPPLRGEDAVRATVRKMSNQEADEVASSVVRLFIELVREAAREAREVHIEAPVVTELVVNGAGTPRHKILKAVPQVISRA